jgi:hypothetical protein
VPWFWSISLTAQYPFEPAEHIVAWWRARGKIRIGWVIIKIVETTSSGVFAFMDIRPNSFL